MAPAPAFPQYDNHPVVNVTWNEAVAYCRWAGGRLPTEAECDYAAQPPDGYYRRAEDIAWFYHNSGGTTHAVGYKAPTGFGLHDMLGNVWEWVADWYDNSYWGSGWVPRDPPGPASGFERVVRGGSFYHYPHYISSCSRIARPPQTRQGDLGFRCAIEAKP